MQFGTRLRTAGRQTGRAPRSLEDKTHVDAEFSQANNTIRISYTCSKRLNPGAELGFSKQKKMCFFSLRQNWKPHL